MLPISLLVTRRRRDIILPVYADLSNNNIGIAQYIIKLYLDHVGKKKYLLNQRLYEVEDFGYDYRFVRGLTVILDRRCRLEVKAGIDPIAVRRKLFEVASIKGIPTSEEKRYAILSNVAIDLKVDVDELMNSFYGDLEDEMVLAKFDLIEPIDLIKQYNLSLTQTLLFNASELFFTAKGNWKEIFRKIKWLGLIYTVNLDNIDYLVKIDGPISLFKLTKRYGTSFAKLIPSIINSGHWKINAKIVDRLKSNRLLNLELDSLRYGKYVKQVVLEEGETYDSTIEEDFAIRFKAMKSDWSLIREPQPLPVGTHIMLPDFLIRKGNLEVFLEIIGFWTPEYLEDKMKKLSMVKDVDMIVAVDKHLACQQYLKRGEHLNLFFFKGKIPLKPIFNHLEAKEKDLVESEVKSLQNRELKLTSLVVDVEDIAKMIGISINTVKKMINQLEVKGYKKLSNIFIEEKLLNDINTALNGKLASQKLNLAEASIIIESMGGKEPSIILEALGYQIVWHGINPKSAEIYKKNIVAEI